MTILAQQVCDAARSLIGIPFLHQGRDRKVGLDCGGVFTSILDILNIPYNMPPTDYRIQASAAEPHLIPLLNQTDAVIDQESTDVSDLEPGCLVAFYISGRSVPQHCGIVVDSPGKYEGFDALPDVGVVHSHMGLDRCVEEPLTRFWWRRVSAIFHIKGVQH